MQQFREYLGAKDLIDNAALANRPARRTVGRQAEPPANSRDQIVHNARRPCLAELVRAVGGSAGRMSQNASM